MLIASIKHAEKTPDAHRVHIRRLQAGCGLLPAGLWFAPDLVRSAPPMSTDGRQLEIYRRAGIARVGKGAPDGHRTHRLAGVSRWSRKRW